MPGTLTHLGIHCIFSVRGRRPLIEDEWSDRLFAYMSGILRGDGVYAHCIGGWKDHVHLLIELPKTRTLSDVMRVLKCNSSKWINQENLCPVRFNWQEGYAAFSCSRDHFKNTIRYIQNQKEHHKRQSFKQEFMDFIQKYEIEYDERYLFQ